MPKNPAPFNRTLILSSQEEKQFEMNLIKLSSPAEPNYLNNKTINQNLFEAVNFFPDKFIDLIIADPPYNLTRQFNSSKFKESSEAEYESWIDSWISLLPRLMKDNASIYFCCDWKSSNAIYNIAKKYFKVQNRITWEREKGRGAKSNWKNCSEDIWFCTKSNKYIFNIDDVKMKRKVLAPYRDNDGEEKDWFYSDNGKFRITYPSNLWTDISIPFWSMPENTIHPTQKPEKLIAKLILASSKKSNLIFDPFLGSGTTSVAAKKLGRNFLGVELDKHFCCLAEKRLELAEIDKSIQGYIDGIFWERNTLAEQTKKRK